jgi:NTE family protein
VTLGESYPATYTVDYNLIPGPSELAVALLNPFSRKQLPPVPNILQVIVQSMMAGSGTDPILGESDVLVRPALPQGLGFMSWEHHDDIFRHAYRGVAERIGSDDTELDGRLQTILRASRAVVPRNQDTQMGSKD